MAERKWTPGPWRVNKYGGIGSGERGTALLIISGNGWAHDWVKRERERHTADRALIAAAPEMAEALEALAAFYALMSGREMRQGYDFINDPSVPEACRAAWLKARAALARARGES